MRPIPSIVVEPQGNWPRTQDCAAFYRLIDDGKFGNAKVTAPRQSNIFSRFLVGRVARGAALSLTIRIGALGLGFAQAVLIARGLVVAPNAEPSASAAEAEAEVEAKVQEA